MACANAREYWPIEHCWRKIKQGLSGGKAGTREELESALVEAEKGDKKSDILGWFDHCGYSVASD